VFDKRHRAGPPRLPFTAFWLLGAINSLNLIDGMDGLLGCLGTIITLAVGIMAAVAREMGAGGRCLLPGRGPLLAFLSSTSPCLDFLETVGSMLVGLVIACSQLTAR